MTTEAMNLANRANSKKSTGPKTVSGKNRSRYNAVKHALTSKTGVLLPDEDPEEFKARIDVFTESLEPRDELEVEFAERAALASWQLDRASRAAAAKQSRDVENALTAAATQARDAVLALGDKLFFDSRGPLDLYGSLEYDYVQPRTSWSGIADDENSPARIVNRLEGSLEGCRWLLGEWGALRELLESGDGWQSTEKIKSIRLMGKQPLNAVSVKDVALVFLASHAILPQFKYAFQELRCETYEDQFKLYKARLSRRDHRAITPKSAAAARDMLLALVDRFTERLRGLEAEHLKLAGKLAPLQSVILGFDESKGGEQNRRYTTSCNGLMIRNVEAIRKGRKAEAAEEGRQQKAERENLAKQDRAVLIMDEDGAIRYDAELGTIEHEEGRARYLAARGNTILRGRRNSPCEGESNEIPRVPDYAVWVQEEKVRLAAAPQVVSGPLSVVSCVGGQPEVLVDRDDAVDLLQDEAVGIVRNEAVESLQNEAVGGDENEGVHLERNDSAGGEQNEAVESLQNEAVGLERNEAFDLLQNEAVGLERNEAGDLLQNEAVGVRGNADGGKMKPVKEPAWDSIGSRNARKQRPPKGAAAGKRESRRERRRKHFKSEREELKYLIGELAKENKHLLSPIAGLEGGDAVDE